MLAQNDEPRHLDSQACIWFDDIKTQAWKSRRGGPASSAIADAVENTVRGFKVNSIVIIKVHKKQAQSHLKIRS